MGGGMLVIFVRFGSNIDNLLSLALIGEIQW